MKLKISYLIIIIFGAFLILNLIGCEKDEDTVFEPKIFLETNSLSVPNNSSEQTIDLLSNEDWSIQSNVDWINFMQLSGEKGRYDLPFSILENEDDERTGTITFSTKSGLNAVVEIVQEAGNLDEIYVKSGGTGEGRSWADATSLEHALEIAVTGNTIHIAEGTYKPTKIITEGDPSDDADKTFEISTNISLKGGYPENATKGTEADPDSYTTILSGDDKSYHVVAITATQSDNDEKVVIQDITITKSNSERSQTSRVTINGNAYLRGYGGGIIIGGSNVDIINTKIVGNKAGNAAGIYANHGCTVTIKNSQVNNNIADLHTGGVWVRNGSIANIYSSEIKSNQSGGVGTGIYTLSDVRLNVYNTLIADNIGNNHGVGLYLRDNSKANIVNVIMAGNNSPKGTGGGIMMYAKSELNLINSTISQNITGKGGGLWARNGPNKVNLSNTIISGNEQGEGPEIDETADGDLNLTVKASIIESKAYGLNGDEIVGATFNPGTMLENTGNWILLPVGNDNPAIQNGMSVSDLITLGGSLDPKVDENIIGYDFSNNSRKEQTTMGAIVKVN